MIARQIDFGLLGNYLTDKSPTFYVWPVRDVKRVITPAKICKDRLG